MGVYGLWRLLNATGKPVPLETLEGKVLGIDISIWIYQVLQGYQDHHGNTKPNAHLLGLFHRICKLLYYKIKPVFVFDGGVPTLKKNTIASRRKQRSAVAGAAQKKKTDLISNLIRQSAVKTVLNEETKPKEESGSSQSKASVYDMFKLPDVPGRIEALLSDDNDSDSVDEISPRKQKRWTGNIHNVDVTSNEFKSLPADVRYDILTDLKETRKQNSWGRLHEMPEESQDFAKFQMKRLLKRRLVQECLESTEKEMGGRTLTLEELDKLLTEQGISTKQRDDAFRIASDNTTRLIYISDKNTLASASDSNVNETDSASNLNETDSNSNLNENESNSNLNEKDSNSDFNEKDFSSNTEIEPVAGPSKINESQSILDNINEYELDDDDSDFDVTMNDSVTVIGTSVADYDFENTWESESELNESRPLSKKYFGKNTMNPALSYMLEHSGLTQEQIITLIEQSRKDNRPSSRSSSRSSKTKTIKKKKEATEKSVASDSNKQEVNSLAAESLRKECSEEIVDSDSESDFVEVSDSNKISDKVVSEGRASDSSDTNSDDFIEIQDVPVPDMNNAKNKCSEGLQITIRSDASMGDDLFADIFGSNNESSESTSQVKSKSTDNPAEKLISEAEVSRLSSIAEESAENVLDVSEDKEDSVTEVHKESASENEKDVTSDVQSEIREDANARETKENADVTVENVDVTESEEDKDVAIIEKSTESVERKEELSSDNAVTENKSVPAKPLDFPVNEEELTSLKTRLESEQQELMENIGKLERRAVDITDQIRSDAQELLRLFGIPYVVAPMEAEAQCAYLEQINLTDGTITDDSDIWLFGGQCVYKNFFNNNKRVLRFQLCDIQHHFKLSRQQMIQLALLVGSDYTTGVTGIGPVTALEVLAAFPTEGDNLLRGLHEFCSWIKSGRSAGPGRAALRNKLKNVQIEKGFPSQAVVQAYLFPTVDESKEKFTWGKPDLVLLSDYARMKFGWTKAKFDEIMKPILKRIEETQSQRGLDSYFKIQATPKSIEPSLSKRIQKAVQRLNNETEESVDSEQSKKTKRRKPKTQEAEATNEAAELNADKMDVKESTASVSDADVSSKATKEQKSAAEYIPQREKDKANALKKRLHAIEVFRKSKQGLSKSKKVKRTVRKIMPEAKLSESDSSSS